MDEIGFPKNLPDEFKAYFAAAHNEIIYLKEKINTLTRMYFGQKSERHAKEELILPQGSLFNEPEQIISEQNQNDNLTENNSSIDPSIWDVIVYKNW